MGDLDPDSNPVNSPLALGSGTRLTTSTQRTKRPMPGSSLKARIRCVLHKTHGCTRGKGAFCTRGTQSGATWGRTQVRLELDRTSRTILCIADMPLRATAPGSSCQYAGLKVSRLHGPT